ncbi:MAG TPA: hypothetical protein VJC09_01870 [Candidatus Saccharimonadales bacterium]|nr:hypothetical protein [Candidatus Saccharimonadales bacterium]
MKKLNKAGFGIIEWFIILLIILLLMIIGWWITQNSNKSSSSKATPSSSQQSNKSKTADKSEPKKQAYLEIKEWGIKLPLSSDISGAHYVIRDPNPGDPAEYVDIFDGGFDATKNKNGVACKDDNFPLFVIGRVKNEDLDKIEGPDKDGYKKLPLSATHQFNGAGSHQAYPVCADLTPNGTQTLDQTVVDVFDLKVKALEDAYAKVSKL